MEIETRQITEIQYFCEYDERWYSKVDLVYEINRLKDKEGMFAEERHDALFKFWKEIRYA